MRRLFLPEADLCAETVEIEGTDYHHLVHVLRVGPGDPLIVLDNTGRACHAEVLSIVKRSVTVRLSGPADTAPEAPVSLTIAQALGKGDKFEQVIQHATEIGASAFIPLATERAVVRLVSRSAEEKRSRWFLIAKGAAEQAGRARIPSVEPVTTFAALLARFADYAPVLLLHPEGERLEEVFGNAPIPERLLLLVGPEGGFTPQEVESARAAGARIVSLGPYTLRTETAALVAASQVLYHVGLRGDRVMG